MRGVPSSLDGIPVVVRVTGEFVAEDDETNVYLTPTTPVPIGVSSSNEFSFIRNGAFCTGGTLGAALTDGAGTRYGLGNNHVFANENGSFGAGIGTDIIQPGLNDSACSTGGTIATTPIGTLHAYVPIVFDRNASNVADAAIALAVLADLDGDGDVDDPVIGTSTPDALGGPGGYGEPSTANVVCSGNCSNLLGTLVKKRGRTTHLKHGVISGVNGITLIKYGSGHARFIDQIIIDPAGGSVDTSAGGDSGSLWVTENGENPVGLHFAGGGSTAIANRIDLVFAELNNEINDDSTVEGTAVSLSVDGKAPEPTPTPSPTPTPTPGITVTPTSGLITTEAGGQDTFDVVLDTLPSADVTIALSSSDLTEGTVSSTSLTFTPTNGTAAQTVTVTGVDDPDVDGDIVYTIVTGVAVSDDGGYAGLDPSDVSVTNTDDDAVAFGTGTVHGRVKSTTGGKISGATVTVESGPEDTTNNGGKYTIDGVDEGPQDVTASLTGCTSSQTLSVVVVADGSVKLDFELDCP